jgi:hypothetical protein
MMRCGDVMPAIRKHEIDPEDIKRMGRNQSNPAERPERAKDTASTLKAMIFS